MITITILCLFVYGYAKAVTDTLQYRYDESIFAKFYNQHFFDPQISWQNKYDMSVILSKSPWYYLGLYTPKYKEAFPFSTTILVAFTDAWHFFNWIRNRVLDIILLLYIPWYWVIIIILARQLGFSLFYYKLLKEKTWQKLKNQR